MIPGAATLLVAPGKPNGTKMPIASYMKIATKQDVDDRVRRLLESEGMLPSDVEACVAYIRRRLDKRGIVLTPQIQPQSPTQLP